MDFWFSGTLREDAPEMRYNFVKAETIDTQIPLCGLKGKFLEIIPYLFSHI